jgi:hypothetical protein
MACKVQAVTLLFVDSNYPIMSGRAQCNARSGVNKSLMTEKAAEPILRTANGLAESLWADLHRADEAS